MLDGRYDGYHPPGVGLPSGVPQRSGLCRLEGPQASVWTLAWEHVTPFFVLPSYGFPEMEWVRQKISALSIEAVSIHGSCRISDDSQASFMLVFGAMVCKPCAKTASVCP
jgi:hypothetical protein